MMPKSFTAAAVALTLMLDPADVVAQQAIPQLSGEAGRVVILDASGSMRRQSFDDPRRERMEVGRDFLVETFDQLADSRDSTPTSLLVFGANQNLTWDSVANQYGNDPSSYPASGPLCRDSSLQLPYAGAAEHIGAAARVARDTQWGGMTLLHVAMNQALASFDPTIGGQVILVSDMDSINCLPPGATSVCDTIAPTLREIRRQGGDVSAIVFETPTSTARAALSECIWTSTYVAPPSDPDVEGIVTRALETIEFTAKLKAGGANNLDPDGINEAQGTMTVRPSGESIILANGPMGTIRLPQGTYEIEGSIESADWAASITVSAASTQTFTVDPSELVVRGGSGAPAQIALAISRPTGQPIATIPNYRFGDRLELANGDYVVTGTNAAGQSVSTRVTMTLGSQREATLTFAPNTAPANIDRDVSINVTYAQPTLDLGRPFLPAITLSGPGFPSQPVTASGFSGRLAHGEYTMEVSSNAPHTLPFDVVDAPGRLTVDLVVTPGIFEARTNGSIGTFELRDASGAVLFTFVGNSVVHSILDGVYELSMRQDGSTSSQTFTVSTGQRITLNPF